MAASTRTELAMFSRGSRSMVIDQESPAGAWADELRSAPWGYGQSAGSSVRFALAEIRARGLWTEAEILEREILALRAELEARPSAQSAGHP